MAFFSAFAQQALQALASPQAAGSAPSSSSSSSSSSLSSAAPPAPAPLPSPEVRALQARWALGTPGNGAPPSADAAAAAATSAHKHRALIGEAFRAVDELRALMDGDDDDASLETGTLDGDGSALDRTFSTWAQSAIIDSSSVGGLDEVVAPAEGRGSFATGGGGGARRSGSSTRGASSLFVGPDSPLWHGQFEGGGGGVNTSGAPLHTSSRLVTMPGAASGSPPRAMPSLAAALPLIAAAAASSPRTGAPVAPRAVEELERSSSANPLASPYRRLQQLADEAVSLLERATAAGERQLAEASSAAAAPAPPASPPRVEPPPSAEDAPSNNPLESSFAFLESTLRAQGEAIARIRAGLSTSVLGGGVASSSARSSPARVAASAPVPAAATATPRPVATPTPSPPPAMAAPSPKAKATASVGTSPGGLSVADLTAAPAVNRPSYPSNEEIVLAMSGASGQTEAVPSVSVPPLNAATLAAAALPATPRLVPPAPAPALPTPARVAAVVPRVRVARDVTPAPVPSVPPRDPATAAALAAYDALVARRKGGAGRRQIKKSSKSGPSSGSGRAWLANVLPAASQAAPRAAATPAQPRQSPRLGSSFVLRPAQRADDSPSSATLQGEDTQLSEAASLAAAVAAYRAHQRAAAAASLVAPAAAV